jgi:hypothetical protein
MDLLQNPTRPASILDSNYFVQNSSTSINCDVLDFLSFEVLGMERAYQCKMQQTNQIQDQ